MKILVIGPSWIGDMMMSQSLYRTLMVHYPQSTIDVVAPTWCSPLLSFMPEVKENISISFRHKSLEINKRFKLGFSLRKNKYDCAYILPNSFKSALVPLFAGIPHRIGWLGEMRYGLLNDIRNIDKKVYLPMVERYIALAYNNAIINDAKGLPKPILWPRLQLFNNEKLQIYNEFNICSERQIIGLCPGSEFGPAKCWPHYHYSELAKCLINEGYQILIFGSMKECKVSREIIKPLGSKEKYWCHNLVGKTKLKQAVVLIAICEVVVTNDSGLMHVAAALNRPLIVLYGPSNPNFTPPLSNRARIIRFINGYYKIRKGDNEYGYHHSLINIAPNVVLNELKELILNG